MNIHIAISPCPNDTFIFDALYSKKITHPSISFTFELHDIETLNEKALQGDIDLVKISFAHYFNVIKDYSMLPVGAALGYKVGPLFISNNSKLDLSKKNVKIAIPGEHTTANFLLKFAYPNLIPTQILHFTEIENALLNHKIDAGVIIHENRFTYQEKGLKLISDLGTIWEEKTNLPIPLGGIAVQRKIPQTIVPEIVSLIQKSIQYAWNNYPRLGNFIKENAAEMKEEVMRKHIELYVNQYSENIGTEGKSAVEKMKTILKCKSNLPLFSLIK